MRAERKSKAWLLTAAFRKGRAGVVCEKARMHAGGHNATRTPVDNMQACNRNRKHYDDKKKRVT